jgi:hypothetical protein
MAQNRGTKAPERLNVVKLRASRTQLSASQLRDHANLRLQLDKFKAEFDRFGRLLRRAEANWREEERKICILIADASKSPRAQRNECSLSFRRRRI